MSFLDNMLIIFNHSDIVIPLTRLTRKGVLLDWSSKADSSFQSLKEAFTKAPFLLECRPVQDTVLKSPTPGQ